MAHAGDSRGRAQILHVKPLVRFCIRGYQLLVSPVLSLLGGAASRCRFEPSCSHYFLQAVETHGTLRGSWLGIKRLGRCHPWGGHGFDPVPPKTMPGRAQPENHLP